MNQDQPPWEPPTMPISYEPNPLPTGSIPARRRLGFGITFPLGIGFYLLLVGTWWGVVTLGGNGTITTVVILLYFGSIIAAAARRWWGFVAAMLLMIPVTCLLLIGACFYMFKHWNG